ncbi:preprotein translocase subunit SecA [Desulfoluna sp.]|uniref:preprotein translocase subunit SecA n=1 Tax=Desulfoluna sp. TaxID=2045199 RepID=UPI0026341C10|nr:preprotein translocase subunit SecA [Desulfoluna sp.]
MMEKLNIPTFFRGELLVDFPPARGEYRPEREVTPPGLLDRWSDFLLGGIIATAKAARNRRSNMASEVGRHGPEMAALDEDGVRQRVMELRMALCRQGFDGEIVARAFALIREVSERTLGMRPFDVQIMGAWAMISGMIAEMETGEGKTLTATLAAGTAAMAGLPVHVISVNDYLTERDAELMRPLYEALGLSVGFVTQDVKPGERQLAYACDITYCTNKDVVFDYLRDTMRLKGRDHPLLRQADRLCDPGSEGASLHQRGLCFAIIDEADSVLIDEARTPLIISGESGGEAEERFLRQGLALARTLVVDQNYLLDVARRTVSLTDSGKEAVKLASRTLGPLWQGQVRREEVVSKALSAELLFHRDLHYLVDEGKVQIIDEFSGRVMPDRSWEKGLHQLIEIKEECELTRQRETLARISYQRFFRRYLRLSGMTGTAREVTRELWSVYRLPVVKIPPNRPVRREIAKDRLVRTQEQKWDGVVDRILSLHEQGHPVLVGTGSVGASEQVSALLTQRSRVSQCVLNARQNRDEAEIVARAGEVGAVTIATNMAGRGTDIKLSEEAREGGGLHVLLTERYEAGRIDRQLAGRCARQGDPGRCEAILSMEDPLMAEGRGVGKTMAFWMMTLGIPGWQALGARVILRAQRKIERRHARTRRAMLKYDEKTGTQLSFSGRSE